MMQKCELQRDREFTLHICADHPEPRAQKSKNTKEQEHKRARTQKSKNTP
jgi:hypothetical protein